MQRVARVYYFRAFFDLALKYTFALTLKSVAFLELLQLHAFNLYENDDPLI